MTQQGSCKNDISKTPKSSKIVTIIRKKKNMSYLFSPSSSLLYSSCMLVVFTLLCFILIDTATCDYENTWNFYYEQPCCGSSSSSSTPHHLRHHRGKFAIDPAKFINPSVLTIQQNCRPK